MRVSDEELAGFLAAAAGLDPSMRHIESRVRYAEDLRDARAALREIVEYNVTEKYIDKNAAAELLKTIARKALEGGAR